MREFKHKVKTTCKFCRKKFDSFGLTKVCPECETNMDRYFVEIRAHLEEFPDATIAEICDELDIPPALIKFYLKEERLRIKNKGRNYFLKCEKCRNPINTGRYCHGCEIAVSRSEMQIKAATSAENARMTSEIAKFHSRRVHRHGTTKK